ncbi:MAG: aldehyde-activating protein [Candidatus Cloacimonadota bacterium]|nr:MAG: aldehyde-activating protein [Candidatus Cloacimonadota bacterium]
MYKGSCICKAITFEVNTYLEKIDACHCISCRKHSGHYFVSTDIPRSSLKINGEDKITWFLSSEKVRRGFCSICGSSLFWDPIQLDWTAVAMGAFDNLSEAKLKIHVHVSEKGSYYDILDNLPQMD